MLLRMTTTLVYLAMILKDVASIAFFDYNEPKKIDENVHFHLYTRRNPTNSYILRLGNNHALANSPLNSNHFTIIYIHGFGENELSESAQGIKNSYLKQGEYNIIVVSWSALSAIPWYLNAVQNLPAVGSYISKMLRWLEYKRVIFIPKLHIIGFSLGAHVGAYIGEELIKARQPKIGRLTGLDPAGPAFDKFSIATNGLSKDDANFVDIIHTNTMVLGIESAVGHVDFYVNYGEFQPGCEILDIMCSHGRAWEYYMESIGSPFGFPASQCTSWQPIPTNCVQKPNIFMGFAINHQTKGIFFVKTNSRAPYGKNTQNFWHRTPVKRGMTSFTSHVNKSLAKLNGYTHYVL